MRKRKSKAKGKFEDEGGLDVPVVNLKNLSDEGLDPHHMLDKEHFRDHAEMDRHALYPGDVLITARSTSLRVNCVPDGYGTAAAGSNLVVIRPRAGMSGRAIQAYLLSPQGQLELAKRSSSATGLLALSVRDLRLLDIPAIPAPEQEGLAELLEASENYRRTQRRLTELYEQKLEASLANYFQHTP